MVEKRWVVERKCIAYLLISLQDGLYAEQSYRLNAAVSIPNNNIVYLIEETFAVRLANPHRVYSVVKALIRRRNQGLLFNIIVSLIMISNERRGFAAYYPPVRK
jgi:ERCC4-type nuclease